MAKRAGNESSIGDIIREILSENRLQPGMDEVDVRTAWKEMMGNGVNSYTRNIVFKSGVLYVELTSAVLREELFHGRQHIIRIMNESLGRDIVKDVVLR